MFICPPASPRSAVLFRCRFVSPSLTSPQPPNIPASPQHPAPGFAVAVSVSSTTTKVVNPASFSFSFLFFSSRSSSRLFSSSRSRLFSHFLSAFISCSRSRSRFGALSPVPSTQSKSTSALASTFVLTFVLVLVCVCEAQPPTSRVPVLACKLAPRHLRVCFCFRIAFVSLCVPFAFASKFVPCSCSHRVCVRLCACVSRSPNRVHILVSVFLSLSVFVSAFAIACVFACAVRTPLVSTPAPTSPSHPYPSSSASNVNLRAPALTRHRGCGLVVSSMPSARCSTLEVETHAYASSFVSRLLVY